MSRLTKKEPNNLSCHHFRRCEYLRNGTPRVETLNKLGKLEDLEEELGCSLEVVFKALTDGFEEETRTIYRTDLMKDSKGLYSFSFRCGLNTIYKSYYLKDYQKTWWLRGERDVKN